jgi:hypothetical protein
VIHNVLPANAKKKQTESVTTPDNWKFTQEIDNLDFKHQACNCETMLFVGSLVDNGTNGGLTGDDMRRVEMTLAEADVSGVANNDLKDLGVGTFAALVETTEGKLLEALHSTPTVASANRSIRAVSCATLDWMSLMLR